jgi:hypothetical protein
MDEIKETIIPSNLNVLITVYKILDEEASLEERENWFLPREESFSYKTNLFGERAAEEAFYLANTSIEKYTSVQKIIFEKVKTPQMSLLNGDIVRVETPFKPKGTPAEYFLCVKTGWEKYTGDVIQLLKFFK